MGQGTFQVPAAPYIAKETIQVTVTSSNDDVTTSVTFSSIAFTINGPGSTSRDVPSDDTFAIMIDVATPVEVPATIKVSCDDSKVPEEEAEERAEPQAPSTVGAMRQSLFFSTRYAHVAAYARMNGEHVCALCLMTALVPPSIINSESAADAAAPLTLGPAEAGPADEDFAATPLYLGGVSRSPAPRRPQQWTLFTSGQYANGDVEAKANQAGFNFDAYSGTVGVDRFFGDTVIAGLATTFTRLEGDFSNAGGSNDTDTTTVMAYFGWQPTHSHYLNAVISQGFSGINQVRTAAGSGAVRGDTDATTTAGSIRIGSDVPLYRSGFIVGAALGADIVYSEIDGYRESGPAAFIIPDQDATSAQLSVQGRIARPLFRDWGTIVPYANLAYAYELAQDRDVLTVTTVDTALNAIAILDDPDKEAWNVGGGLYLQEWGGSSVGVSAITSIGGNDVRQTTVSLRGRFRFGGGR